MSKICHWWKHWFEELSTRTFCHF